MIGKLTFRTALVFLSIGFGLNPPMPLLKSE